MPPHKHPASLISLLMRGTVELIHTSAVNIDKVPTEHPAYLESINTVQEVLLALAPPIWEVVYDDITATRYDSKSLDYILIHKYSKKLFLKQHVIKNVNFLWRPHNKKLKSIVELDLTSLPQELTTRIMCNIETVCESSKLESITFDSIIPEDFNMLAGCTELRSISYRTVTIPAEFTVMVSKATVAHWSPLARIFFTMDFENLQRILTIKLALELFPKLEYCNFHHMEDVLSLFDINLRLNLLKIKVMECSVEQINKIVTLCPHLHVLNLDRCSDADSSHNILEILSSSSLQISELINIQIKNISTSTEKFFLNKGIHLRELNVRCNGPNSFLKCVYQLMSMSCKNLTHLTLGLVYKFNELLSVTVDCNQYESELTNLQELTFYSKESNVSLDIALLRIILPRNSNITSIRISCDKDDEFLIGLFDSIKMDNLKHFKCDTSDNVEIIVRCLYQNCPSLTHIELKGNLEIPAETFMKYVMQKMKKSNLDLIISWSERYGTSHRQYDCSQEHLELRAEALWRGDDSMFNVAWT